MASGGSLKTKLPSFTSMSLLTAQPPASSVNLSSKTTSDPSQADAGHEKPATKSIAATSKTPDLAIGPSLDSRAPHGKLLIASANARQLRRPLAARYGRWSYGEVPFQFVIFRLLGGAANTIYARGTPQVGG